MARFLFQSAALSPLRQAPFSVVELGGFAHFFLVAAPVARFPSPNEFPQLSRKRLSTPSSFVFFFLFSSSLHHHPCTVFSGIVDVPLMLLLAVAASLVTIESPLVIFTRVP